MHPRLYNGFEMKPEKAEMEEARRAPDIAHPYDLKVDSSIQRDTLAYETFFAEEPRPEDSVQCDACEPLILLAYALETARRNRCCISNGEYLSWLKRVVRYAVDQAKTDFIHCDNLVAEVDWK